MAGKFEVYRDKAGGFRFRLKSRNGENILSSEGYSAKASCLNGVRSVEKNSRDASRFVRTETRSGKFRFNLKAGNHQVIGTSQSYETTKARDNGIGAVGRAANGARVVDLTK